LPSEEPPLQISLAPSFESWQRKTLFDYGLETAKCHFLAGGFRNASKPFRLLTLDRFYLIPERAFKALAGIIRFKAA
jgi:hypothetical protein